MQVLNATRSQVNILLDNGQMLAVRPGQLSDNLVISPQIVTRIVISYNPQEVGIIISGSYETQCAGAVTGAVPYLYYSADEAKAKLLDPTVDYGAPVVPVTTSVSEDIEKLKAEKATLEMQLDDQVQEYNKVCEERNAMKIELEETKRFLSSARAEVDELKDTIAKNAATATANEEKVKTLGTELATAKSTLEATTNNYNTLKSGYDAAQTELTESKKKMDGMRAMFNEACKKFRLTYDNDTKEWIQLPE